MEDREYKLCYVRSVNDYNIFQFYFTDNFDDQWGDDWNDRPADCNAEEPYEDELHHIISMYVEFSWMASDIIFGGKTYSIEDMNKGNVPYIIFKNKDYTDYKILGGENLFNVLGILEISGVTKYYADKELIQLIYNKAEVSIEKALEILESV